jgi:predicted Mrr-cat superfamily restriction endonuclease
MSLSNNFWVLRQNYAEITNQTDMKSMILSQKFVTCPWGGWGLARQNVIDGIYNAKTSDISGRHSSNQDKKFVETIQIGDIVLIPFANSKECIICKIVSDIGVKKVNK